MSDLIVGIDLGTTNSAVGLYRDGKVEMVQVYGEELLPSVVGFGPSNELLVGRAARNQMRVHPERTVRSIKRRMGQEVVIDLGEEQMSPMEISAVILRRLKLAAEQHFQAPVHRAVITVPAYFNDAQRTATREAGEVAGLEVERILNEPTAAALCYLDQDDPRDHLFLVYDLGGGTFDVSIVRAQGRVTEVLASHGDTQLGGDDFDALLYELLRKRFIEKHGAGADPEQDPLARSRLLEAAEAAKIRLSDKDRTTVIEEHLITRDGIGLHLHTEVTRAEYEALIDPLIQRTRDSVQVALKDAQVLVSALDEVVLVGGSTRTPLVRRTLKALLGTEPRSDVDPDKAVCIGAAMQAARLGGDMSQRILVDVSPFTFGTSCLGMLNGQMSSDCFIPIIPRNTTLPATRNKVFHTVFPGQEQIEVEVFHGDNPDAQFNTLLGRFMVEDLDPDAEDTSPILFSLALDLNGILNVHVTEQHTGHTKAVIIKDAFRKLSRDALIDARRHLLDLFGPQDADWDFQHVSSTEEPSASTPALAAPELQPPHDLDESSHALWHTALGHLGQARTLLASGNLHKDDTEEVKALADQLEQALKAGVMAPIQQKSQILSDVLFYLK